MVFSLHLFHISVGFKKVFYKSMSIPLKWGPFNLPRKGKVPCTRMRLDRHIRLWWSFPSLLFVIELKLLKRVRAWAKRRNDDVFMRLNPLILYLQPLHWSLHQCSTNILPICSQGGWFLGFFNQRASVKWIFSIFQWGYFCCVDFPPSPYLATFAIYFLR